MPIYSDINSSAECTSSDINKPEQETKKSNAYKPYVSRRRRNAIEPPKITDDKDLCIVPVSHKSTNRELVPGYE
jgi:hypothetical protein